MIEIYFSGCWDSVGHFVYLPSGYRLSEFGIGPWEFLGSPKLHPRSHGNAWLTYEADWTALGIGDMSVDNRPGSNSVFALRGTYNFDQALNIARDSFPHIILRIGDITLADRKE